MYNTSEKSIEAYLVQRVKEAGGKAFKFVSPGHDGVPDRLICMPGGRVAFAEMKAPGNKPTPLQRVQHRLLRELGFIVFGCVDSKEKVDDIMGVFDKHGTAK